MYFLVLGKFRDHSRVYVKKLCNLYWKTYLSFFRILVSNFDLEKGNMATSIQETYLISSFAVC